MRPGPGLVVMALAFISGARRASTSSSSSSSLITTTTTTTIRTLTTTATTPPAITPAATTTTTTPALRSAAATLPSSYDSRESLNFINAGGGFSFFQLPELLDGSPGDLPDRRPSSSDRPPAHNLPFNFDFYRRPALHAPDESFSSSSSSTRRVRSLDEGTRSASSHDAAQSTESAAGAPESSEATLINEEAETEPEQEPVEEQAGQEEEEDNSGLPVQYASSRAFDADAEADVVADEDIFALVAEDDLLSEESFDRLIKLNEEVDEDYNLDASLALTRTQQQQPQQQQQHSKDQQQEQEQEPESQQQDEIRLVDESVLHAQHNEKDTEVEDTSNNNNKRETGEEGRSSGNDAYASHLIAIAQKDGGTLAATVATATASKTSATATTTTGVTPVVDLKKSILGTATALTRLNPWISACDLAQPGTTGTDLQGQCSAGTLPMAWVDEGPGPPICPRSCAEQQPTADRNARNADVRADNKLKYFINANNKFNYKTRLSHNSNNNNNNNNNNNKNIMKVMSRMRRNAATTREEKEEVEEQEEQEEATTATSTTATTEQELEMEMELETMEALTLATTAKATSNEDNVELDEQSMRYSHLQTHEQQQVEEQEQEEEEEEQQQQQQQCLDYLGDAAETSPQHLCGLRSPGQLLSRLRTLRLRHCCERSVFSALHTLALNATLTDRDECVRLLSDLLDVDALANRITCELAEILFRFDCRQVYSLVNQCDDCKEAYRRWVCSALVPYFAEPQDVDATSPSPSSSSSTSTKGVPKKKPKPVDDPAMTKGSTIKSTTSATAASKSKRAARKAENDGSINIKHKSQKLISNNNKSNNGNNMNERQINQQHDEDNEPQNRKANVNANVNVVNVAQAFYNVVGIGQHQFQSQFQSQSQSQFNSQSQFKTNNRKDTSREGEEANSGPEEEQFNNFISTANNADPSATDPVISKLQKRSTCKAEFRKRRRIRPCLSVCQTVEQKCPYLLPADRAPALPTQYAGEPTFSCLDQNIPETGEQLKKSSYGPNDCCYSYCNGPTEGLCTICKDFASTSASGSASGRNGTSSSTTSNTGGQQHRVHNITLTMSSPPGEHARAASVSVALRNVTTAPSSEEMLLERLPYYARHDSVYYYDDDEDEGSNMPDMALSGGCAAVPSVSTRCTIPYYASGVAPTPPTQLLVWLSALLGLLSSCGAARQRCASRATSANSRASPSTAAGRGSNCAASCHELLASSSSSSSSSLSKERPKQRETMICRRGGNGSASFTASCQTWAWNWAWKWAWKWNKWAWQWAWAWKWAWNNTYKVTCRKKLRYFSGSSRSKLKVKAKDDEMMMMMMSSTKDTKTNYRDYREQQLIRIRERIKGSDLSKSENRNRSRNDRNYRYFYYYNYNINDWWRRWRMEWLEMQQGTIAIGAL